MTPALDTLRTETSLASMVVSAHRGSYQIVDQLADDWCDLCAQAADDQPFFRPEFIKAHLRAVSPDARVLLITARRGGRLHLLLPLVEELGTFSKMPVRRLRAPVNFNCGRFDAVRSAGPEGDAAIVATWRYLKETEQWDLLQFRDTQEGSTVSRLVATARSDGFLTTQESDRPNPYVHVPSDPEHLDQMPPNAKLRSQLRQIRRRLNTLGRLNFYRLETADPEALDRFFELEASGWKGANTSAVNCHPPTRQFFNELAESAALLGYFSLYMLELNGQLIAAHYALSYQGCCYSPVVTYNEAFKQFAPGHLIVSEILRDCAARGIRGFDITGQDQDWKMKWTSETHPVNHHFVFRGALGTLAYTVASRLKPALRRLLPARQAIA